MDLSSFYRDYLTRLGDRLNSGEIIKNLPNWICRNTTLRGKPFTFKDHEYQIEIAADQAQELDCQKCSQVGMTELEVRWTLGYLVISTQKTAIYVLPHSAMAKTFTKSRVDPVVETSETISGSVKAGTDSSTMKQFGQSFLHTTGSESPRGAISIPAQILIIDEYDFCNMRVLGMFNSRLRHAIDEMIKRRFSTPTVSNYGIAKLISTSSKKRYMVRCIKCAHIQAPDFKSQIVIPGFDKDFLEFDKDDIINTKYKIDEAYLRCIKCGTSLDMALANVNNRMWVEEFPGRRRGYIVKPFDVIRYNPTASVIRQINDYPRAQDYWNFVHGDSHDTDENKINDATVERCCTGDFVQEGRDFAIGLDIGKICHYMTGRQIGNKNVVTSFGKLRLSDGDLSKQSIDLCAQFGFIRIVVDHGPDLSIPANLQERYGINFAHPAVYVKGRKDKTEWVDLEDNGYVNISRTKGMDSFVQSINKGKWIFPKHEDMREVRRHFQQMVRIAQINDQGEFEAVWEKSTDNDHYFHACFYLYTAITMDFELLMPADTWAPIQITGVPMGSKNQLPQRSGQLNEAGMQLAQMFGRMR